MQRGPVKVGDIYRHYLKRIKVISKVNKKTFDCLVWFNGKNDNVKLTKKELETKELICNVV